MSSASWRRVVGYITKPSEFLISPQINLLGLFSTSAIPPKLTPLLNARYPIEAHAYGGEEGGLLGSIALSTAYTQAERDIRGVLNVEMVGWQPEKDDGSTSTITVLSDPNAGMSEYMTEVVDAYVPTANIRRAFCGVSGLLTSFIWLNLWNY